MKKILFFAVAALAFASCNTSKSGPLSGAGATFPQPFYTDAFKAYNVVSGVNVSYNGVGSGAGQSKLADKTVDFGASDAFVTDKQMEKFSTPIVHIPTCMGAVVIAYKLDGVKGLKLNAEVITAIYKGEIKNWNDPKIVALNPDLKLPNLAITPVYRSDGSGTTFVFSDYMSKANEDWKNTFGSGKALKFTVGVAGKGNPGVAGVIAATEGAVGYIGSEYSFALNIPAAALQNSAGNFVEASVKSIAAAADQEMPADTRTMITNSVNPEAYPIATFTWLIVYKDQNYNKRTLAQAQGLVKLLNYILSPEAQDIAVKTHYASLSAGTVEKAKAVIASITYDGKPIPAAK